MNNLDTEPTEHNRVQHIISGLIEVELNKRDDFLQVAETLTRIGYPNFKTKTLSQSCHILHKQGRYYICHFKELYKLDGKHSDMTEDDYLRRNMIARMLDEWNMVKVVDTAEIDSPLPFSKVKVVKYSEKRDWYLMTNYEIGVIK